jgi:hypothetical protein
VAVAVASVDGVVVVVEVGGREVAATMVVVVDELDVGAELETTTKMETENGSEK